MDAQKTEKKSSYASQESHCRVVASSDGKLPSSKSSLPPPLRRQPNLLDKLGLIYHAISRAETRKLKYLEDEESTEASDEHEEQQLVSLLRSSLEDAGFQELTQRDIDLCEALNAGYLLRLSIQPDVAELDSSIAAEFYPERYQDNETGADELFEGRILIYRRGYSSETTNGRLLIPKLDYLQASLVQGSAYRLTQQLGGAERSILKGVNRLLRRTRMLGKAVLQSVSDSLPIKALGNYTRTKLGWRRLKYSELKHEIRNSRTNQNVFFKLGRYGGSQVRFVGNPNPNNSLAPFLVCQTSEDSSKVSEANGSAEKVEDIKHDMYERLNRGKVSTKYDRENPDRDFEGPMASKLLKRVSIGNVVDVFSVPGRKRMLKEFFSKADLVEPTYEEVIVIWRPSRKKPKKEKLRLPNAVYDAAEIFDMDHKLPEKPMAKSVQRPSKLEVRAFTKVPMANLPGVFPKTRLIFRPADAFLFDLISVFTLLIVLGSQQFDSARLDLLALISVALWIIRTVFRYSNKLARYDLLVKNFLTSKIAHRDGGAIKYIADEGASQKATRAAVLHSWLLMQPNFQSMTRDDILHYAYVGVNEMLQNDQYVDIDIEAGLKDLERLELISYSSDGERLIRVSNEEPAVAILKSAWSNVFEGKLSEVARRQTFRKRK